MFGFGFVVGLSLCFGVCDCLLFAGLLACGLRVLVVCLLLDWCLCLVVALLFPRVVEVVLLLLFG